jgi:hypothetical protein
VSQFDEHVTLPIVTLVIREILLRGDFGGENANSGKFIFNCFEKKENRLGFYWYVVSYIYGMQLDD